MNHSQIIALANALQAIRPDWQQAGIVAQLKILSDSWAGSDAALSVHAMAVAAAPNSQTPGAFNATPATVATPPRYDDRWSEPTCRTCSRPKSACDRQREREFRRGIPDPHDFEAGRRG